MKQDGDKGYKITTNFEDPVQLELYSELTRSRIMCATLRKVIEENTFVIKEQEETIKHLIKINMRIFSRVKDAKNTIINDIQQLKKEVRHNTAQSQLAAKELLDTRVMLSNLQLQIGSNLNYNMPNMPKIESGQPLLHNIQNNNKKIVYISYCHANNRVLSGAKQGWVSTFFQDLDILLKQNLNDDLFELWMDDNISGNSQITKKIVNKSENADAFIVVYSAAYRGSETCNLELQAFLSLNDVNSKKLFIAGYDDTKKPPNLNDLRGYRFWQNGGKVRTLANPVYNPQIDGSYHAKLRELANDITKLLQS